MFFLGGFGEGFNYLMVACYSGLRPGPSADISGGELRDFLDVDWDCFLFTRQKNGRQLFFDKKALLLLAGVRYNFSIGPGQENPLKQLTGSPYWDNRSIELNSLRSSAHLRVIP